MLQHHTSNLRTLRGTLMAKKNNKSVYIAALFLFIGGLGYLLFSGFSENSVYFLNVAEAKAMQPEKLTSIRMFGTVKAEGIQKMTDVPGVVFLLEDQENKSLTIPVEFKGAVPDTFKAGAEVIIEGGIQRESNIFVAKTLMTKCPSKYEKENREG